MGSLLSTVAVPDLCKVNSRLPPEAAEEALALVSLAMCHAIRVGQLNRVLTDIASIRLFLTQEQRQEHSAEEEREGLRVRLGQKVETLVAQLTARRHYVDKDTLNYDPRYLVFEFIWNIVLRDSQLDLVNRFRTALEEGKSKCCQLIMVSSSWDQCRDSGFGAGLRVINLTRPGYQTDPVPCLFLCDRALFQGSGKTTVSPCAT